MSIELYEAGFHNVDGVDYSENAINLAIKLAQDSDITDLNFFKCDILSSLQPELVNKYMVCVDKGTYDAIRFVHKWYPMFYGFFTLPHLKKFLKPAMFGLLTDSLAMFGLLADSFSFVYGGKHKVKSPRLTQKTRLLQISLVKVP